MDLRNPGEAEAAVAWLEDQFDRTDPEFYFGSNPIFSIKDDVEYEDDPDLKDVWISLGARWPEPNVNDYLENPQAWWVN
jgi:hypothetical protein